MSDSDPDYELGGVSRGKKRVRDEDYESEPSEYSEEEESEVESIHEVDEEAYESEASTVDEDLIALQEELAQYAEDMMGDEADRAHLQSLTEMEREMILADRYEKQQDLEERLERRRDARRQRAIASGKKTVRTKSRLESSQMMDKRSALEDLKARREDAKYGRTQKKSRGKFHVCAMMRTIRWLKVNCVYRSID